jgi:hypothetical protein
MSDMNTIKYNEGGSISKENKEMLMNQAIELKHHADELMKVLEKSEYIEPWVVAKAERATTDLSDITHYLEGNSRKMKWGGYMKEGGEVSEFNMEEFLKFIYPNVKDIMDSNNIDIDKEFIVSKDMKMGYVPHFMYEYEDNKVSELAIYYFDGQDKHIGHIEIDLDKQEIEVEFPSWNVDEEEKYEDGGMMAKGGRLDVGRYYKTKDGRQVRYLGDTKDPELGTFMNKADGVFKVRYDEIEGNASVFAEGGEMKKGGITGDLHSLTDELLAQKIQIFIDKIKPIKYYYIDEDSNSLIIGLDENYTQDAADKLYKEATLSMEFFDADSVDMHYIPHKKQTEYSIKLKKVAKFGKGGKIYVDLFENRDEMPYKVKVIVDRYEDEYGEDISYQSLLDMQREVENVGYTFDFGLDSMPYGLRPIGVDITQLRDYDEDDYYADGGMMADGGGIGFIPMDLEEDLMLTAKWGGTNIKGVIGILNAMIDSNITDEDLKPKPTKSGSAYEKARAKKTEEIWAKIVPKYKGDFKGNMYYSTIMRLVERSGSSDQILKRYKPFRKFQKDYFASSVEMADGGMMARGGATFSDKVKSISKRLNKTKVPLKYRKEYGKYFNKKEATQSAQRIVGAITKKEK